MTMNRVRTVWTGVAGTPYYSNHYFTAQTGVGGPQDCVDAVGAFWVACQLRISSQLAWAVESQVFSIDETNGEITAVWTTEPGGDFGDDAGEILPRATQGLVRWTTGVYLGGRQIRGRTFIPGPTELRNDSQGTPDVTYMDTMTSAGNVLMNAAPQLVIWSPSNGTYAVVNGVTTWDQWSVLRSRRD